MVFPKVYAKCASAIREDAVVKVRGRVERREGIPRLIALDVEELHLEPGLDPIYLDAGAFVGLPRAKVFEAFEIITSHPGETPLVLVSQDGEPDATFWTVEDCSDLHAELKQLLGPRCVGYARSAPEPEMERVS
jgi:DNA polymerase-3 subunit alpha